MLLDGYYERVNDQSSVGIKGVFGVTEMEVKRLLWLGREISQGTLLRIMTKSVGEVSIDNY